MLNLRRRKLPLSLCARLEDRCCTHCTKINKNLKYNSLLGRAEIHTIQISFVVLCWVVLKHETAPLLDAGATKWAAHALHFCGSKHFCQSLFALHTWNTYICICNTRCSVFAVLSILVYVQCAGFICSSHVSHLHLLSGGCSAFRVVDISANTPQSTIFSGGMRLLTGVKDCWENVESWQEETLRGWEFSIGGHLCLLNMAAFHTIQDDIFSNILASKIPPIHLGTPSSLFGGMPPSAVSQASSYKT